MQKSLHKSLYAGLLLLPLSLQAAPATPDTGSLRQEIKPAPLSAAPTLVVPTRAGAGLGGND